MRIIERKTYLETLIRNRDRQIIKVISGVRRCGKSTLLESFMEYLLNAGVSKAQVVYINFEDIEFEDIRDYRKLYDYVTERLSLTQMNYVFLDEIQHVEGFMKAIDSLYIKKNVDLYITGSNAQLLSGEFATLMTGRFIEVKMLPLSFAEYCEAKGVSTGFSSALLQELYRTYLENSSFPYTLQIDEVKKDVLEYLRALYNSILLKDIIFRKRINDALMLESVARFLFNNVGKTLSSTKIAHTMTSFGRKIDQRTVEKYLEALRESQLFYEARRYNVKGKQELATLEKYYAVDIGLRFMLLGGQNLDVGHILENVVYLELLRRDYEVFVGQVDRTEIDFMATRDGITLYIQIAASIRDEDTLARELRPLRAIGDNHPKLILTLDDDPDGNHEGIVTKNALRWLLDC
ncbi:MAG: ATP-binding protein [Coriobacteriia bacterium]|nr:ATP-binding protein [Coriobacteriia bacterium]